ncbi:MAG: hypothetical protein RLZZ241_995 [Bacteroidota bacterium]|jgi:hypothetical protein
MRFLVLFITLFFCVCCADTPAIIQETEVLAEEVRPLPALPKYFRVSNLAAEKIKGWGPLSGMMSQMQDLPNATTEETLSLNLEALESACKDLESAPFPEPFNISEIQSRVKVVRTFIQKAQSELSYNLDFSASLVQAVRAYNALLRQIDRVTEQEDPGEIPF